MAKAYWVVSIRKILNADRMAAYSKLAAPAIAAGGGRIIARGTAKYAFEAGLLERTVVTEFDSLEAARATFDSDAYQAAVKVLDGAAERDFRIVDGTE
ncbi:DUF1330 domain-containing protein [Burkholderia perseverans]|uniref:DUF1330 domain-containing protein n=1 Tax=Burkholderia perseverans TaxID=2615214 RepID=UPI001FEDC3E0|nr:DUF1330 domain-containing protein [Burkholderia perseverans]